MAFLDRIARDHGARATLYPADEGRRADLAALAARRGDGGQVCACGPDRMIEALKELMADQPARAFAFEHFAGGDVALDPDRETGFDVELTDSGLSLHVPPDRTLLSVLRGAGIDLPSDCEEGLCGTCECAVVAGEIDHRDKVLSAAERAGGDRMMSCCSRAKDGQPLRIAL
jgi:ferredoxin